MAREKATRKNRETVGLRAPGVCVLLAIVRLFHEYSAILTLLILDEREYPCLLILDERGYRMQLGSMSFLNIVIMGHFQAISRQQCLAQGC